MRQGVPSRTALRVAIRRAAHQILDHPKVLDDPLAVPIVGEAIAGVRANETRHQSRIARGFRAFMVARSRYAEDQLAASVSRGVRQYVILGAGLDTSAYRGIAASESLRVFEVDHPQTQAWKKERLQAASIAIPSNVSFVPVTFEKQNLPAELAAAGFAAHRPAFVSWLGVVPYLTREARPTPSRFSGDFRETAAWRSITPLHLRRCRCWSAWPSARWRIECHAWESLFSCFSRLPSWKTS